jgi:hypothetical protein
MQFRLGRIPDARDFVPDQTWKPLREPGPWLMQLFALPLGLAAFVSIGWLWFWATPLNGKCFESPAFLNLGLFSFIPMVVVHELIHAAVHPGSGSSDRSILGFWPSRLLFYAHYDGALTRNRFIAILAMPTVVITLLPLAVAMATSSSHELVAWISTWNAFFACGDLFGIMLLLFQVKSRAICRNHGYKTFWKTATAQS